MKNLLIVGLGSFLGGILRYLSTHWLLRSSASFPWGTLSVNILGCLLIGILSGFAEKHGLSESWRYFIATGVLGGFTTFSAFSNETFMMIKNGNLVFAFLYIVLSVCLGLVAAWGGYGFVKNT